MRYTDLPTAIGMFAERCVRIGELTAYGEYDYDEANDMMFDECRKFEEYLRKSANKKPLIYT